MNLWQASGGPRGGFRLAIGQGYQRPTRRPTRANCGELVATWLYTGWFLPGDRQARVWRCRKVSDFGDEKVSSRSRSRPPLATARDAQQSEVHQDIESENQA